MSQLPQAAQRTACPVCQEPLEPADNYCGGCGVDLSAAPASAAAGDSRARSAVRLREADGRRPAPPGVPVQTAHDASGAAGRRACAACRSGMIDDDGYCEHCGHAQPRERDHMEHETAGVAAVSDRGLRHHRNEDAYAVATTALPDGGPAVLAVVCDGVSSAARSDEASAAASSGALAALESALTAGVPAREATHRAILEAAERVSALAASDHRPREHQRYQQENAPACTIVSAVITGELLTIGWVGDSRAYWVPDDRATQPARLTEDDSWAAQMVAAGLLSEAEAYADERAHAITGWLGADAYEVEPHTAAFHPDRPGVVIVCTDGLWNYAETAEQMAAVIPADARDRPLETARHLVGYALDGGGHDNVTVAVLPFPARTEGAGTA
ncbi:serine/threonine-protein phosphatase [Streptomyces sp. AV19]|uniref:PP2C family protein-serine/threonine phosphatase n=1 Tax=Streptomyces sp. AV19 TaxID=2793068 RepID=UPI0018FE5152|nr:PP2C family serine/threonine-protein phosphatase [Streptomyces sp. AV19]MBH1933051.1 serine/threonine-protein phosphatase [Streptomyces sp. AV19]MDG4531763.1 serine/threonine-protein phosphatase [Streptomyces sp. AV19]